MLHHTTLGFYLMNTLAYVDRPGHLLDKILKLLNCLGSEILQNTYTADVIYG